MNNTFPKRIKELRSSLCKTQSDFADFIGTTQSALSGYENGDRTPSYEILIAISQKCNVSIDWLCGLSDKMTLDRHITTYKDLFTLFINLLDTKYQGSSKNIEIWKSLELESNNITIVLHDDPNFKEFFTKWCKICVLHNSGDIDDDLYKMWIEKQLKEYDYPINGLPSCFQNLPEKEEC